jgi:3'(2'), 5'-bisphosphate nucleotidase
MLAHVRALTKDDRSPVTVADYAVQAIVALSLLEDDPAALIAGEEHAGLLRSNDSALIREEVVRAVRAVHPGASEEAVLDAIDHCGHDASAEAFWTLDPIDGTKGFLRGEQYAIALARLVRGEVVLGVMGCPNLPMDPAAPLDPPSREGVICVAERGRGASVLSPRLPSAAPVPIRTSTAEPRKAIRVCESVESSHTSQSDSARIIEAIGASSTPVRLDSQAKYAVVARGQADAYLRLPTRRDYVERIWDHAAGSLIATEAGAIVTDITGAPLDFNWGRGLERNRGIVCATSAVHGRIIDAIARLGLAAAV